MENWKNGQLIGTEPDPEPEEQHPVPPTIEEQILALQNALISQKISGGGITTVTDSSGNRIKEFSLIGKSEQATTTGKNLFDKSTAKQGYEFPSAGADAEALKEGWFVSDFIPVKSETTYYISGKTTGAGCKMYNKDKVFVKNIQALYGGIRIENDIAYFRINGEIKDLDLIQVEEGTVATDYEPYTGGKPSPSPEYPQEIKNVGKWNELTQKYEVDVKVTGNNLFDKGLIKKAIQGVSYKYVPIYVKKGSKVSFSYRKTLPTGLNFFVLLARDMGASYASYSWLYHSASPSLCINKGSFIAESDVISLSFTGTDYNVMMENLFDNLQIEISDTPTNYEPYKEQTLTLSLDQPLRRVGDFKDIITKDGIIRKNYEQRIESTQIKPNEYNWDATIPYFRYYIRPISKVDSSMSATDCPCTIGKMSICYAVNSTLYWGMNADYIRYFGVTPEDTGTSALNKIKNFIDENEIYVIYPLETPIIEPLPEDFKQAIESLKTYYPTTVITTDGGEVDPDIEVTYIADTKNYIDQKIAAIGKTVVETQKALL